MRALTKSELISRIFELHPRLTTRDSDVAVNTVLCAMIGALSRGMRVEVRGFGSFSVKYRPSRDGRNPRTGETVRVPGKYVPYFRAGKEIRDKLNPNMGSAS